MAFGLRDGLDLMIGGRDAGAGARSGRPAAGTASPLWRQILADVLDAEIATVNTTEGAAYGAGLLAAVGAGWFPTRRGGRRRACVTRTPGRRRRGRTRPRYAEAHATYRELYPALAPIFPRL